MSLGFGVVLGCFFHDESSGHGGLPIISQSFNYSDTKWYYIAGSIGRLPEFVQLAAVLTAGAGYFYPLIVCVSVDKHTENTSLQVGWLGQQKQRTGCQGLFFPDDKSLTVKPLEELSESLGTNLHPKKSTPVAGR